MTYVTVATPPMKTVEEFDALVSKLPATPDGMRARYVGSSDGELRIVSVWDTKDHAERFFADVLAPARAQAFGPEALPGRIERIDVARELVG